MTDSGHIRHTFPKSERLTGKKSIEELFKHGSSFYFKPLLLKYRSNPEEAPSSHKLLISVPKKKFKRAVDRNLLKRRIREGYRLNKSLLHQEPPYYHLALVYLDNIILPYAEVEDKLIQLLKRLEKLKNRENEEKK